MIIYNTIIYVNIPLFVPTFRTNAVPQKRFSLKRLSPKIPDIPRKNFPRIFYRILPQKTFPRKDTRGKDFPLISLRLFYPIKRLTGITPYTLYPYGVGILPLYPYTPKGYVPLYPGGVPGKGGIPSGRLFSYLFVRGESGTPYPVPLRGIGVRIPSGYRKTFLVRDYPFGVQRKG